jgi:glycosyltransferase involved in cell wall biosynthesis
MKVLVISEHYFPVVGGTTTYVQNLCKSLSKIDCEVFLVTIPDDENPTLEWYDDGNFHVYRLKIPKLLRKERYFPIFLRKKLKGIIKDVDPDVVHFAHGFFAPLVTRTYLHKISNPVIWTVHNVPPKEHKLDILTQVRPLHKLIETVYFLIAGIYGRLALKASNYEYLICVSEKTTGLVIDAGVSPKKIKIIDEGVDTDVFKPKGDILLIKNKIGVQKHGPVFLTVGGIIPHKGQDHLIKAVPGILKKFPDSLFLLVGQVRSEEYLQELQKLVLELNVSDSVKIITDVESGIDEYYKASDIYVQPSLEEGFCLSILEAMACGKPVIGTKTGAIPKFISESKGGILIEPASSDQIYDAIVKIMDDGEEIQKMGLKSRDYVVENYSWDKTARDTLELYKSLF